MTDGEILARGGDFGRVHVTGGPGAGKTRFATRLADARSVTRHDLDGLLLAVGDDFERFAAGRSVPDLAGEPAWVSDGVYFAWAQPFLERADLVVWLDVPWRVASYRMIVRHLQLELTRKNRFPGWRRFYSFWRWAARYYADRNEPTIDRLGVPTTRSALLRALEPYRAKVIACRTNGEIDETFGRLSG